MKVLLLAYFKEAKKIVNLLSTLGGMDDIDIEVWHDCQYENLQKVLEDRRFDVFVFSGYFVETAIALSCYHCALRGGSRAKIICLSETLPKEVIYVSWESLPGIIGS